MPRFMAIVVVGSLAAVACNGDGPGGAAGTGATPGAGASAGSGGSSPAPASLGSGDPVTKPRIVATTDGEVDDRSTMIRFLMYSSDYDVAGIIQVNSRYQRTGHSAEKWVENEIDLYEQLLPNLRVHNPNYPDADSLRSVVRVGNENVADILKAPPDFTTQDTPGAQLIIDTLLDDDPRPVHIPSWGGANTTAYALWKLKTAYTKEQYDYAVSRIRMYCIYYQDAGGYWIEDNIPGIYLYESYAWDVVWNYQSIFGPSPDGIKSFMTDAWVTQNVKTGHGPLGMLYGQKYVSEGDTVSFLPLIDNGLEQYTNYPLGGWGGRPVFSAAQHMVDGADDGNKNKAYWRWIPAAQNDFAARMQWGMASSFADANHNPMTRIVGDRRRTARAGDVVTLDASPTTDPDGNNLSFDWWQYHDADSVNAKVTINDSKTKVANFIVPSEPGKQLLIVLEVTDDGTPPLTHYQRVIVDIQ